MAPPMVSLMATATTATDMSINIIHPSLWDFQNHSPIHQC